MAAHPSPGVPRPLGVAIRLRSFGGRMELDRRLAAGADPSTTPALARRAAVLMRPRSRRALAAGLTAVVADAATAPRDRGAAVPVLRQEVHTARRDLLRLAAALRSDDEPGVRGVAQASLLLTDGAGPIFCRHPPGYLRELAFRAAFHAEAG